MKANEKDIEQLNNLYRDRYPVYGDLHNHSASGGTSDGKRTLEHWKGALEALKMDFAAILDHRQVRHLYLDEWDDGIFVSGTEPGTIISDSRAENKSMHYNMLFENRSQLEKVLNSFPEYQFKGGSEGHFVYPEFTVERFCELIDCVKKNGGFFVYPHPKQLMRSDDPLDYWFRDETGLEVFYGDMRNKDTEENYALWCALLAAGKRVFASAGEDGHACASDTALTTLYAKEKFCPSYIYHLRLGDFVCGGVGIKMCIGDTGMGGVADFSGKRLVAFVGDLHKSVLNTEHDYELRLISDRGVEDTELISPILGGYFAWDIADRAFYRIEVFDKSLGLRIAIGNPIWNSKIYKG